MNAKILLLITSHAAALAVGIAFGYWNWKPHQVVEMAAPVEVLAPAPGSPKGGQMAERKTNPSARPKQVLPAGTKPERIISADITPDSAQRSANQAAAPCPKIHVDATIMRDADGGGRVLISSPDGITTNATDTVVQSMSFVPHQTWAVGGSFGTDRTWGGTIEHDVGRVRIGADVLQRSDHGIATRARVLFTFGG